MGTGTVRSFISIPVHGLPGIERCAREMGLIRGVTGVRPENLHMTLKFLGDMDRERNIPDVIRRLGEVAGHHGPFTLPFGGTGHFPEQGRIRVVYIAAESDELVSLARDVIMSLGDQPGGGDWNRGRNRDRNRSCNLSSNRDRNETFIPHLTIGRVKRPEGDAGVRRIIDRYSGHDFGSIRVDALYLMASTLTPQGPIHDVLRAIPLTGSLAEKIA